MNTEQLKLFISSEDVTISYAMRWIDNNSYGILFLIDKNGLMTGCVTDGDIRRYLLCGGKLDDSVYKAQNSKPKYARNKAEAKKIYHKKNYVVVPIVDEKGAILDLYTGEDESGDKSYGTLNIPIVINAGGKGTRLEPFTRVLPKPLIPVGEFPIIELIMREFQKYDCESFHIIANYKKELLKTYFVESDNDFNITWYDEEKPLGTGGGLSLLKGKICETFVFSNCDALLSSNYESIYRFHKDNKNMVTMICAQKRLKVPYGVVKIDENNSIIEMTEKPELSFYTNTGIYMVEPEVIDEIEDDVSIGFPDVIDRLRKKGEKIGVYKVEEEEWMDMGQIPELEKMRKKLYGD